MGDTLRHVRAIANEFRAHLPWHGPGARRIGASPYQTRLLAEFSERLTANRFADGLAHPHVIERGLFSLHGQVGNTDDSDVRQYQVRILLHHRLAEILV